MKQQRVQVMPQKVEHPSIFSTHYKAPMRTAKLKQEQLHCKVPRATRTTAQNK